MVSGEEQPGQPDPSENSAERKVRMIFLEMRNASGDPALDTLIDVVEALLHNHNAWMLHGARQEFARLPVDSGMGSVPEEMWVHRFFSTRKVTELRVRDAVKIRLTLREKEPAFTEGGPDRPVVDALLFRNEQNNWRKFMNPGKFTFPDPAMFDSALPPLLTDWMTELAVLLTYKAFPPK